MGKADDDQSSPPEEETAEIRPAQTKQSARSGRSAEAFEIFKEIFSYEAALPKVPDHPEGVQVSAGLSTLSGVFLPCCQNILGVIVFLRLAWLVGECGVVESFQIVFTCCLITFTTAISMAAIATNGPVPAGGAYFMINRCLGPEFGGGVGILFYLGTTFGASMYVIGAIEILILYVGGEKMLLIGNDLEDAAALLNNFRVYGTLLLIILCLIVFMGVAFVNKFAIVALLCVIVALTSIFIGIFFHVNGSEEILVCSIGKRLVKFIPPENCTERGLKRSMCDPTDLTTCDHYYNEHQDEISLVQAFPGLGSGAIWDSIYNLYSNKDDYISWSYNRLDYAIEAEGNDVGRDTYVSDSYVHVEEKVEFLVLLGIFFPSVTGIMAGSNRSGDLEHPQKAIPVGTLAAILTTTTIYLAMSVFLGGTTNRLVLLDKYGKSLSEGGGMVASYLSWPRKSGPDVPSVTEIGALLSTIGAGLQALTGAPRLLQAIAKDRLMPVLNPFAVLSNRGEPARALLLTAIIAEAGILIGALDLIAPLLSMFFLLFYAGVNLACTVMSLSANPGWRPSFKYYHWSVSMVGVVLCFATMFSIKYTLALVAIAIFGACFYGIKYFGGVQEWGAGVRGLALSFATQSLIRVSQTYGQARYWRPQILHLVKLDKTLMPTCDLEENAEMHKNNEKSKRHSSQRRELRASNLNMKHPNSDMPNQETYEWKVRRPDIQLFKLGSQIMQGSGLAIGACVVAMDHSVKVSVIHKLKQMIQQTMRKQDLDGLAEVCVSEDEETDNVMTATSALIQLSGLGALRPNTIMVHFPREGKQDRQEWEAFKRVLEEAVTYEMALIVPVGGVRHGDGMHGTRERGYIDMVLLNQNDTGFLLMIAYLIHNHPMWRKCILRVLIPIPNDEKDKRTFRQTRQVWLKYLDKVRIAASVVVFHCQQTSLELNKALRNKVYSPQTKLTLMSMRRDPEPSEAMLDEEDQIVTRQINLNNWLLQCRQRIWKMENCIFLWNAGMPVIND